MFKLFYLLLIPLSSSCYNEDIKHLKSEIFELKNEVRKLEQLKYEIEGFSKTQIEKTQIEETQLKRAKLKNGETTLVKETSLNDLKNNFKSNSSKKQAISAKSFSYSINEEDDPVLGNKDLDNVIMVFSNFQSKLSSKFFKENLDKIKKEFIDNNKFKLILRDFPLSTHKESINAANFANCAAEQGKYWDAFKILFNNQELINHGKYLRISRMISGVNVEKLVKCSNDLKYLREIKSDKNDAKKLEIKGVPNIFIGKLENGTYSGSLIRGAQPIEIIKQYLKKYE